MKLPQIAHRDGIHAEKLEQLERRLLQLEIEREALRKEKDKASKERLAALERNSPISKPARYLESAMGCGETRAGDVQKLREALELARTEMEKAQRQGDLRRVAEYQYGKFPS